jgi:hypothetical protein
MIEVDDFLFFVDEALDALREILVELGDEQVNARPDVSSMNSPAALVAHCLGVMEQWGGQVVAGRVIVRDRDAEFGTHARVAELVARLDDARRQLRIDLSHFEPLAPPRGDVAPADAALPIGATQGGALVHMYSELAQHRGHLEISRDLLLARWVQIAPSGRAEPQPDSRYGFTE